MPHHFIDIAILIRASMQENMRAGPRQSYGNCTCAILPVLVGGVLYTGRRFSMAFTRIRSIIAVSVQHF